MQRHGSALIVKFQSHIEHVLQWPPGEVRGRYEQELLSFLKSRKADLLTQLDDVGTKLEGDLEKQLRDALTEFAKQFSVEEKKK